MNFYGQKCFDLSKIFHIFNVKIRRHYVDYLIEAKSIQPCPSLLLHALVEFFFEIWDQFSEFVLIC